MNKFLLAGVMYVGVITPTYASTNTCNLIMDRADEQSSILRAPTAIVGVGDNGVTEQSAIIGVQLSLGDRKRAALIDDAAKITCLLSEQQHKLNSYMKYAPTIMNQIQANAENLRMSESDSDIEKIRSKLNILLNEKQITIIDIENFSSALDLLNTRKYDNSGTLSVPVSFDKTMRVQDELELYKAYTSRLERVTGQEYNSTGWDVIVAGGARKPIYGYSGNTQAFGTLSVRYSFGNHTSHQATERAAAESVAALKDNVSDPTVVISELMDGYKKEREVLDHQIHELTKRNDEYTRRISLLNTVDTAQAYIVYSNLKLRQIQIETQLAGLHAKRDYIVSQMASVE